MVWRRRYKPISKDKIIKQVFADKVQRILVCDVIGETESHYICYSAFGQHEYTIRKDRVYEDREDLKYVRWVRRTHLKPSKARQRFLTNTKMKEYKKRYIKDFPEKLI